MRRANSASEKCGVPRQTAASDVPSGTVERPEPIAPQVVGRQDESSPPAARPEMPLRASPPRASGRRRGTWRPTPTTRRRRPSAFRSSSSRLMPAVRRSPGFARRSAGRSRARPRRRDGRHRPIREADPAISTSTRARRFCGDVQAVVRNPPGDRAAEVDEVAVAVGARADHGIGKHDGVRLRPGDLRSEARAKNRLVGRAGEGWHAAELLVRRINRAPREPMSLAAAEQLRMDQVDGARRSAWSEPAPFRPAVSAVRRNRG